MKMARDSKGWFWVDWFTEQCRHDAVNDAPDLFCVNWPNDNRVDIEALDREVPREYFARIRDEN